MRDFTEVHTAEGYEIRRFAPGDEASILECHAAVFGPMFPDRPPRTLDWWKWQYLDNPSGQRIWVAARESDGAIHAQYASTPCRVRLEGRDAMFAQITDSMRHPDAAGTHTPSLFLRTAWPLFVDYGGPEADVMMFGVPTYAHFRLGHRYLKYEIVRTESALYLPGHRMDTALTALPSLEVVEQDRVGPEATALYDRVQDQWGASIVRDEAALNWRYADHPGHDYTFGVVPDGTGGIRALAVVRHGDWIVPNMTLMVDWICPDDDDEAGLSLARWLVERARARQSDVVGGWLPEWCRWFDRLQDFGWLVGPTNYFMVGRHFHKRVVMDWLKQNWFYTLGDTDQV